MALTRVKIANTTIPEVGEAQVVMLAAQGSDGKPYLIAVDEGTGELPVTTSGGVSSVLIRDKIYKDYSLGNVTTAAYTELIASTSALIKEWSVFDSSGQTMVLASGGAGAEVDFAYIQPGGGDAFTHQVAAGTRISIKAVSDNATVGNLVLNAWG